MNVEDLSSLTPKQREAYAKKMAAERQRAKTDKLFLANEVLGCTFVPEVHNELFEQFIPFDGGQTQLPLLNDTKSRLILWPRGHFKTTSALVEIVQLILNYPNVRIVIMRSTKEATQEWLNEVIAQFTGEAENSRLAELFPEFCGSRKALHATNDRFTVPCRTRKQLREATVTTASATSNKTGKHFDAGFFDDLVTDKNAGNEKQLKKVIDGYYMCIPLIDPGGYMYVTGTRYAHGDLYQKIIDSNTNDSWIISVKDCWNDDQTGIRFPQQQFTLRNGDTKVIGFTRELLDSFLHADPAMFSSQYLNRPASEADQHFTREMFDTARVSPEAEVSLSQSVLIIDTASSTGTRRDDSVILVGQVDPQGTVYVTDGVGGRWPPEQIALTVIMMTMKHRPLKVLIETTAASQMFVPLLKRVAEEKGIHVPVDFLKADSRKDAKAIRIKSVSTYLTKGWLKLFSSLPCYEKLVSQAVNYSPDRGHDDYPDTLGYLANYLSGNAPMRVSTPVTSSRNTMMNFLVQNEAMEQLRAMNQPQRNWDEYVGTMGDDFCC